jgi:hypothetical protein
MIIINLMPTFLNRLKDRGWKKTNVNTYGNKNIKVLSRGSKTIIVTEGIDIDASVDIMPQIEAFFETLMEIIKKTDVKEVFLPGGGNIALPNFFADFCAQFGIKINFISLNSYGEFINYN